MARSNWIAVASVEHAPTLTLGGKDKCQHFISIDLVQAGQPYAFDMGGGFVPFRWDVAYVPAQEAAILPLLEQFEFVVDRAPLGYKFRFGLFKVVDANMRLIAQAMQSGPNGLLF